MIAKWLQKIWYGKKSFSWLCLYPLSLLYRFIIFIRRVLYKTKFVKTHQLPCKIIIVGNITVGGSGKTPMVKALAQYLQDKGCRVGIICKGYKGLLTKSPVLINQINTAKEVGDEAIELFNALNVPIVACQNRVAGSHYLYQHCQPDIIISDDGLSHLALSRDIEIIMQKQGKGLGNGSLLPAGPLREPAKEMKENQIAVQSIIQAHKQIQNEQNQLCIFPQAFVSLTNDEKISLDQFAYKTCYAIAGIAHPQTFFDLLKDLNIIVIPISFADHHHFSKNDFKTLTKYPVLMTEKDAVKCESLGMENSYYLQMGGVMSDGLIKSLEQCLKSG